MGPRDASLLRSAYRSTSVTETVPEPSALRRQALRLIDDGQQTGEREIGGDGATASSDADHCSRLPIGVEDDPGAGPAFHDAAQPAAQYQIRIVPHYFLVEVLRLDGDDLEMRA